MGESEPLLGDDLFGRILFKQWKVFHVSYWNGNVLHLVIFSSMTAPEVVKMATSSAASDENVNKMMTFPFQLSTSNKWDNESELTLSFAIFLSPLFCDIIVS